MKKPRPIFSLDTPPISQDLWDDEREYDRYETAQEMKSEREREEIEPDEYDNPMTNPQGK